MVFPGIEGKEIVTVIGKVDRSEVLEGSKKVTERRVTVR